MIFLLQYDRRSGRLLGLRAFDEGAKIDAENARLELELRLNSLGVHNEVVLLEADTEAALRRTHRRYFEDLSKIASSTTS